MSRFLFSAGLAVYLIIFRSCMSDSFLIHLWPFAILQHCKYICKCNVHNTIQNSCATFLHVYMCMYICVYVKRKVRIRTIRGFCCANPGSTLCTADPRITFQPALSADCACMTNEMHVYLTNEMRVWRQKCVP